MHAAQNPSSILGGEISQDASHLLAVDNCAAAHSVKLVRNAVKLHNRSFTKRPNQSNCRKDNAERSGTKNKDVYHCTFSGASQPFVQTLQNTGIHSNSSGIPWFEIHLLTVNSCVAARLVNLNGGVVNLQGRNGSAKRTNQLNNRTNQSHHSKEHTGAYFQSSSKKPRHLVHALQNPGSSFVGEIFRVTHLSTTNSCAAARSLKPNGEVATHCKGSFLGRAKELFFQFNQDRQHSSDQTEVYQKFGGIKLRCNTITLCAAITWNFFH